MGLKCVLSCPTALWSKKDASQAYIILLPTRFREIKRKPRHVSLPDRFICQTCKRSSHCISSQLTPARSRLCRDHQHRWETYISAKKTPDERDVWWTGCCPRAAPRTLSRQRGTTPTLLLLSPPDVPAVERMWPFKSEGVGWAEIHDGLITLSVVKLKLYIQSIGFMTPLQHLIEIKCQNAWLPRASNDAN